MPNPIVKRYTQALFEIALESSQLEDLRRDMVEVGRLIAQSSHLADFLQNPVISPQGSQIILKDIFEGKINELTLRFLFFLSDKKRLSYLSKICVEFEKFYAIEHGILTAELISSEKPVAQDINILSDFLKNKFKSNKVNTICHVDQTLLGGIKVKIGDTIFDYSLKAQLEKFKQVVMRA